MVNYTSPATTAISDTRPAESDGKVWVDTSENPPKMKLYDSATGAFISASENETIVSQTKPTPEVGKIWFEPVRGGTNMYAASSEEWEFLKFLPGIPDGGNLQARYDFTDEGGSLPITDKTGNGNDLDTGGYTGTTTDINGTQAGEFDGADDFAAGSFTTSISEPFSVYVAAEFVTVENNNPGFIFDGDSALTAGLLSSGDGSGSLTINAGNGVGDSSPDTNPHVYDVQFGGTDELVIDGTVDASGDAGSAVLNGVTLGARGAQDQFGNIAVGEVLVYDTDHSSSTQSDVRQYLADGWGITL